MGKGGDAVAGSAAPSRAHLRDGPAIALKEGARRPGKISKLKSDLRCLRSMWFKKQSPRSASHAARLENFYVDQAADYDQFRASFLWGRRPMLASLSARLDGREDLVWVDLGGGTAENVLMMDEYLPLAQFKKVVVVDLCSALVKTAKEKVARMGWKNVEIVEGDATSFKLPEGMVADVVTFSYSLSMMPNFHAAVDNAAAMLKPETGLIGVADFFVSSKHDLPLRQMKWLTRWFWRSVFDTDNIDIGPERRSYIEHRFTVQHEFNSAGGIPYVPLLRAPWYSWIGTPKAKAGEICSAAEAKIERPPLFPPTFLYGLSWEDPRTDEPILNIGKDDVLLTLTSGGCNAFDIALQGAKGVYCVDMNPAQTYLLDLKMEAVRRLPFDDVWQLFGEGKHPEFPFIFERYLAPFLSQGAIAFWRTRFSYFSQGLFYQGGMGKCVLGIKYFKKAAGIEKGVDRFTSAPTLEEQRKAWYSLWVVRLVMSISGPLLAFVRFIANTIFMNQFVMWFGAGVPHSQTMLIYKDGRDLAEYVATVLDGAARDYLLSDDNYFYHACLQGRFTQKCCPKYLKLDNFNKLRDGSIDNIHNITGSFIDELNKRTYTKVILMDHVDWLNLDQARELAAVLGKQVAKGGTIIWRSASMDPPYSCVFAEAGFDIHRVHAHSPNDFTAPALDRVNMYASFWYGTKL